MREYLKVNSSDLKTLGKLVGKTRHLPQGVHTLDRKPDPANELYIKEKQKNPYEKRVIQ